MNGSKIPGLEAIETYSVCAVSAGEKRLVLTLSLLFCTVSLQAKCWLPRLACRFRGAIVARDVVAVAMVQPPVCGVNEEGGGEVMNAQGAVPQPLYGRSVRMREFEAGSTVHLPALTAGAAERRLMEHSDHEAIKIYLWSRAGLTVC